eukprot:84126_1
MYNDVNIKGQDIDLYDPGHQFEHIFDLRNEKKLDVHDDDDDHAEKKENKTAARILKHRNSIRMSSDDFQSKSSLKNVLTLIQNGNEQIDEMNEISEIIKIELPIHSTSIVNMLERGDFSFNNVIIPFNSVYA